MKKKKLREDGEKFLENLNMQNKAKFQPPPKIDMKQSASNYFD